jgi:putative peptidoglycan lipid II flippase
MSAYGGGAQYTGTQRSAADFQEPERGGVSRVLLTVVVVLVLAVIAATVWAVGFRKPGNSSAGGGHPSTSASGSTAAGDTVLTPATVSTFNILGKPPGNTENEGTAQGATDSSLSTAWSTSFYYDNPQFGGIKKGTGLLIDMGKEVRLSQVEVLFGTYGATTAEIYLGNSAAMSEDALSNFKLVSPSASATGKHDFPASSKATGRYVLIWLTNLPKLPKRPQGAQPGHTYYEAQIYNVVVRGSAVSGSS